MRTKAIVFLLVISLISIQAVGFGSVPAYRLGPYRLNQDPFPWLLDESEAVNHILRLSLPGSHARIDMAPEFLQDHEITDQVQEILESQHRIWLRQFRLGHGDMKVLEHEFLPDRRTSVLSVSVGFEKEGVRYLLKRLYHWVPAHQMVLAIEASAEEAAWGPLQTEFYRIINSVRVDEDYEVSPCVRTLFVARRFNRLREVQIRSGMFLDFQRTLALYKQALIQESVSIRHHQWGHLLLLAYLEGFNTDGVYLGHGADLEKAKAYLDEARGIYPNPEALNSLTLENLPELFDGKARESRSESTP